MKIGVLSDIHGDLRTLQSVLEQLDNAHQVADILCAGDLVGRGPEQDRVVEVVRQRKIRTVRGNHDEWFYDLAEANSKFLRALPVDLRISYPEAEVFMCHGKPGSNMWGLYRDHVSETLLNMMLESLDVDVLITGHTHVPLMMRVKRGLVVNPGSLYTFKSARGTSHTYGVLDLNMMDFQLYNSKSSEVMALKVEEYE